MQLSCGHMKERTQTAIAVDAQGLMVLTAIGVSPFASGTGLAVDIRFDRTPIPDLNLGHPGTNRHHFNPQLVPGNSWVGEERHLAEVPRNIGTTNAHPMHTHQGFTRTGFTRLLEMQDTPRPRFHQLQCFQINQLSQKSSQPKNRETRPGKILGGPR